MKHTPKDNWEQRIRFVVNHYQVKKLDADIAWRQFASGQGIRRSVLFRRYLFQVAAVLLVVVAIGVFYLKEQQKPQWVVIVTEPNQVMEVFLPDSSQVSMAGNSEIRYDKKLYGKERRTVEMNGKAFFQVQRDEERLFSVLTEQTETIVLGTSFQIAEQEGTTKVYVESGKVSFSGNKQEAVLLTSGMSASYSVTSGDITIQEKEEPNILSWRSKSLRFNETPVEDVIRDISSYYQVNITDTSGISGLKLTATFDNMPLDEVLFIINQTLDIALQVSPVDK